MVLSGWTVDYGDGPLPCTVPHAWCQDVPLAWEGPAVYRCSVFTPHGRQFLVFHGVSYQTRVFLDDAEVGVHEGIWDAFWFELAGDGRDHQVKVEAVKNGGESFPVRSVASGFIPFVFHTFGGIFKPVELVASLPACPMASLSGFRAEGTKFYASGTNQTHIPSAKSQAEEWLAKRVGEPTLAASAEPDDGREKPTYLRGVLTWGWYPELGHLNPPENTIHKEIDIAKKLGFNLIKFCLWVPPHRYLELMHEKGLMAWIELPLWDPTDDTESQEKIVKEFERIVDQYRHHPNIALWTCGCELHATTTAAYRKQLYDLVKARTGGLVKDNSGSAEMYGGDLREYGDFYDFHPYCDTHYYPEVLDSLQNGPRKKLPILLGEFNDIDVHRDLARIASESPYWVSQDAFLNDQGVRWQHDLPALISENRFAQVPDENRHTSLIESSRRKSVFMRKIVQEAVRARDDIAGYVITGWRDTPISTAGVIDDWEQPRFRPEDFASWNRESSLFIIPSRRPPWVNGGNRSGWIDPYNWFEGRAFWKIGIHSEVELEGNLDWDILHFSWNGDRRPKGKVAQGAGLPLKINSLESTEIGEISWDTDEPGGYLLRTTFSGVTNTWPFWIVPEFDSKIPLGVSDRRGLLADLAPAQSARASIITDLEPIESGVAFLLDRGTSPMPFWRECAYEFLQGSFWDYMGYREAWERLLPMSTDRALDMGAIHETWPDREWEVLMNRIDMRTYKEHPMLIRSGNIFVTTLRPFGGLGNCPAGISRNPSGAEFLRKLMQQI